MMYALKFAVEIFRGKFDYKIAEPFYQTEVHYKD